MNLSFLLTFVFLFVLNANNGIVAMSKDQDELKLPIFDFLNIFHKKLKSDSLTKQDMQLIQFLSSIIFIRQKQIENEENSKPIVYWHLRQGR